MRIYTVGDLVGYIMKQRFGTSRSMLLDIPGMTASRIASFQVLLGDMVKVDKSKEDRKQDVFVVLADEEEVRRKLSPKLGKWIRQL